MFALPVLFAASIEAPLALASDRLDRKRVLALGMLVLGAALLLAGWAPNPWLFSIALACAGAASGAACAAAQSELIASSPLGSARALSRWTAYAALGDALVPLFVAGVSWFGYGYRGALCAIGLLSAAQALSFLRAAPSAIATDASDEEPDAPLTHALWALRQEPRLFLFLLVSSLCCLLDEVVVALAALRFRLDQGQSLGVITLGSTLFALGGVAGALLTDRLLTRVSVRALLWSSSSLCLSALVLLTTTDSVLASFVLLTALGLASAPHHALIQAAAYEELPGKPGLVNAALQLFVVIEIAAPLAVGMVAAEIGLNAALLALAVQPLAVAWVADRTARPGTL